MHRHLLCWPFFTLLLFVTGCAGLPVSRALPPGITSEAMVTAAAAPFAVDPAGRQLAFTREGLRLFSLDANKELPLTSEKPAALAWSPNGRRLAAAFPGPNKSLVRLYGADGATLGETQLAGTVGDLAWRSADELLIAAVVMTTYKFGSDFQQLLTRWDTSNPPVTVQVHNATLRPGTVRGLGPAFARAFTLAVSPLGDEIAFTRLHDPPQFTAYLRIMLRHLDTGSEREVANIDLQGTAPAYLGPEDQLLMADGKKKITRATPWLKGGDTALPTAGRVVAASPGGKHLLIDGQLISSGELITTFPATVTGSFAADGSRLLLRHNDTIYLVSGLAPDPITLPSGDSRQKLLTLRALRAQGLITPEDFDQTRPK